jgi:hypothetical protein
MKVLHAFDMDDTIMVTPTFADLFSRNDEFIKGFVENLKKVILIVHHKEVDFIVSGDFIVMVDPSRGNRPIMSHFLGLMNDKFIDLKSKYPDPELFSKNVGVKGSSIKNVIDSLGEKDGHIVIMNAKGFHANPDTIGTIRNSEVHHSYDSADNKMIVTGRKTSMYDDVKNVLINSGVEFPNKGLHLYDGVGSIKDFKIRVILDSIENENWNEVHFYEDRHDWLDAVAEAVKDKYPDVKFVKHHIDNIHKNKSL